MSKNITIVIPAYNPDEKLIHLLKDLQEQTTFHVIVVNDGSAPEYRHIFEKVGAYGKLMEYERNQGKGHALKVAYHYIYRCEPETDFIITADADGQHKVSDLKKVAEALEREPGSFVIGSREFNGDVPFRSKFGNELTRKIFALRAGVRINDTQSGLRGCHRDLLPELLIIEGDRYEYEMNVLLDLAKKQIPMREVTIETVYLEENKSSHFRPVHDSYLIYKQLLKFSGSSILSFFLDYIMYSILVLTTGQLILANVGARAVSSIFNFSMNRKLVFKSKGKVLTDAAKYFTLAAGILVANTGILYLLVTAGCNKLLAKIIVECILFTVSYYVQHHFIFKHQKKEKKITPPSRETLVIQPHVTYTESMR